MFHVERRASRRYCVTCKGTHVVKAGGRERSFKGTPIGTRRVRIVVHLHRQECRSCGARRLEPITLADPKRTYTRHLARYVLELCKRASIADVVRMVDLPWKTVCAILRKDLEARQKKICLRHLKYLAIDEVSVGKGQNNYLTVVLDLTTGHAVHVVEGRTKKGLQRFFARLRRMRVRVKAVAMDMHAPFRDAVLQYYGTRVVIVYDHFHISKLLNEQLDDVRREQMRLAEAQGKSVLKGIRFLLLRASETLQDDGEERLQAVFAVNATLFKAYILKEELRECWRAGSVKQARTMLRDWITQARASGILQFVRFSKTLESHMHGILAFFRHPISTGPLEAFNNNIGLLIRRSYGYRNRKFLMLRILFLHECHRGLTGA